MVAFYSKFQGFAAGSPWFSGHDPSISPKIQSCNNKKYATIVLACGPNHLKTIVWSSVAVLEEVYRRWSNHVNCLIRSRQLVV